MEDIDIHEQMNIKRAVERRAMEGWWGAIFS